MSFFIRNSRVSAEQKRKANGRIVGGIKKKKKITKKSVEDDNENIESSDEEYAEQNQRSITQEYESETEDETAQEKRVRLAKKYLEQIEEEERDRAEFEEGTVTKRLHEEYLEEKGRIRKTVAASYIAHEEPVVLKCKEHKESLACLCITSNGQFLYSGSKDGSLVKWLLKDRTKLKVIKGKWKNPNGMKCVQCIAVSTDGKFLVVGDSGCKDVKVFSGDTLDHIKNLQGHRGSVSGLAFRKDTHTLYSSSEDRCVKVWNLDDMAYVESLFGHQSGITSIDALAKERAITSGGFDGTVRIWKIVEESQLIFNGHGGSIDCVKLINEENFLSCGSDGQLCVWGCLKKKPLCSVPNAHGNDETNDQPMWISSIATLLNTDLVASGSRDGAVRLWQCADSFKSLKPVFEINLKGFINALVFTPDGTQLIAAVGQEHRLGRWWRISDAKNSIVIIPLIQVTKNK